MKKFLASLVSLWLCVAPVMAQSPAVGVQPTATAQVNAPFAGFGFHNIVTITVRDAKGNLKSEQKTHNLVTNAGFTYIEAQISGTPSTACAYIGLASDSSNAGVGTVAAGDTTLATSGTGSTEIAANGLSRAVGTFSADTPGAKQYTVAKTFTASGTQGANKVGLFSAASNGTMCYEALFTAVTVNNTDTLTITWTVTLS